MGPQRISRHANRMISNRLPAHRLLVYATMALSGFQHVAQLAPLSASSRNIRRTATSVAVSPRYLHSRSLIPQNATFCFIVGKRPNSYASSLEVIFSTQLPPNMSFDNRTDIAQPLRGSD